MAPKIIANQLITVANLYKISLKSLIQKDGNYMVPEDHPQGWTTSYFADIGGYTKEEAASEAKLLKLKGKIMIYKDDLSEGKPKIMPVIPEGGEPVIDVMNDFRDEENICLIGETISAWVRGRYVAHFVNNYSGCTFTIVAPLKPVKVYSMNGLVGLIMPIRQEVDQND